MKSKMSWYVVIVITVALLVLRFVPDLASWFYDSFYSWTKISLSSIDSLTGIVALIFSAISLKISFQNEKISIETSKNVVEKFIDRSCSGFKKSHLGEDYNYYRPIYDKLDNHLQRLKNANVLEKSDVELCKKMHNYVRDINNLSKKNDENPAKDALQNAYNDFCANDKIHKNVEEVLKKL